MTRILSALAGAIFLVSIGGAPALAGPIERACLESPRKAANGRLCDCIQRVADQTLSRSDQRQAAKFFRDPHRAQEIRQSDNRQHEAFWLRYKEFGSHAAAVCD